MLHEILGEGFSAVGGAAVGVAIIGTADHFAFNRSLAPFPACPHCGGRPLRAAGFPIVGPVVARGRCKQCQSRSFWQLAALIQALVAVLAVLLYSQYGFTLRFAVAAVETAVLVAIGTVDIRLRLIPSFLVYPAIVLAIVSSPVWPHVGIEQSLAGAGLAFALFAVLALIARFVFGEGALGGGDVTLAALIGAICGYPLVVPALALGAFFGGVGALAMVVTRRTALGTTIPYGPFLVAGVLYVMAAGYLTQSPFTMP